MRAEETAMADNRMEELLRGIDRCECGRTHECPVREVAVGPNALERVPGLLGDCRRVTLVCDRNTWRAAGERVATLLQEGGFAADRCRFDGEGVLIPDEEAIARIEEHVSADTQALVGVGSGVINDLCKYVAGAHDLPYMIVATAPSMDGYASSGAAMILGGMKETVTWRPPVWIVGDTAVLRDAPLDMIRAGIGDILGKYSCLNDWKLSRILTGESFCGRVYDLVMDEVTACEAQLDAAMARDEEAIGGLMRSLVAVGICMAYVGNSRPASGSEHHLSHYYEITGVLRGEAYLPHGVDVAYSTLVTCRLREMLRSQDPGAFAGSTDRTGWEAGVRAEYGRLADSVIALQKKSALYGTDRLPLLREKWDEVRAVLAEAPSAERMQALLERAGYARDEYLSVYGEEKIRRSIVFAKELKDRYTLLNLLADAGLLERFARDIAL